VSAMTAKMIMSIALVAAIDVHAQSQGDFDRGRARFEHSCEPCHGDGPGDDGRAMLPGTDALRIKYSGTLPALIERRTDLTADVIRVFVRRGTWSMPPFRPTEITEADIQDIAAYLRRTSTAAEQR
jgi:mono/diheme cytochrome c family protein